MRLSLRFWRGVACVLAAGLPLLAALPAHAEGRVALVIGNGAYRNVPALPNPTNDSADVARTFERLGFAVTRVNDGRYDDMRRALLEFGRKARTADMAILFYAGHGIEVGGENWLIPIDAELRSDIDVDHEAIGLKSVMLTVESASKLGLVILDACRNNPFDAKMKRTIRTRAVSRGLSAIEPTGNVLVAYAAKDGTTASDGDGRNSPFTLALLKHLETPGLEINFLFRNVRDDVIKSTRRQQQPFVYGSLSKEAIYLKAALPVAPTEAASPAADELTWALIKETHDQAAIRRFIEQFPKSALRSQATARIAALKAEEAARPKPAPMPAVDEAAWALVKDTTDINQLKLFVERFPRSQRRREAEQRMATLAAADAARRAEEERRIAALKAEAEQRVAALAAAAEKADAARRAEEEKRIAALKAEAEQRVAALKAETAAARKAGLDAAQKADPRELARSLQFELTRVGCYKGTVDGEYGRATREALQNFAKLAAVDIKANELSAEIIKAIREFDKRVCPLVCPAGQIVKDDACVAAPAAAPKKPVATAPAPQRPAPKAGGKCFAFQGRQFCE